MNDDEGKKKKNTLMGGIAGTLIMLTLAGFQLMTMGETSDRNIWGAVAQYINKRERESLKEPKVEIHSISVSKKLLKFGPPDKAVFKVDYTSPMGRRVIGYFVAEREFANWKVKYKSDKFDYYTAIF